MDHLQEAQDAYKEASDYPVGSEKETEYLKWAQIAALISIAESLAKLAGVTEPPIITGTDDPIAVKECRWCTMGNTDLGPEHAEWCDKYVSF